MKIKNLIDEMHIHFFNKKLCLKQAYKLKIDIKIEDSIKKKVFIKLFTTTHFKLNIKNTSNKKQNNKALLKF